MPKARATITGLLLATSWTTTLLAQGAGDKAAAETLFQEGQTAMEKGDLATACPKLAESLRLDRALGTLINLARCHQRSGKTASAWAEFREVAELAEKAGQADRAKGAAALAAELEPKLSKLTIEAGTTVPGLVIERDGTAVGEGSLGTAVPVDPGEHVISAKAPGYAAWSTKVVVGEERDAAKVVVPALEKAPEKPAAAPSATPPDAGARGGDHRTLGFVIGGVGLVAIGVGAVLGVTVLGDASDAESDPTLCPDKLCTPEGREKIDAASTKGLVSTIAIGVGAAAVVGGAVLVLTSTSAPANAGLRLRPFVGARGGGAVLSGHL